MSQQTPTDVTAAFELLLEEIEEEIELVNQAGAKAFGDGHEGQVLHSLVGESCDCLVRLPMRGHVKSLNAAVAGSVMLYQAWQARTFVGDRAQR